MKQLIHFIINNSVWEYLLDTNHRETREKKKENTNIARDPFPMIVLRSKEKDIMNYELNYWLFERWMWGKNRRRVELKEGGKVSV